MCFLPHWILSPSWLWVQNPPAGSHTAARGSAAGQPSSHRCQSSAACWWWHCGAGARRPLSARCPSSKCCAAARRSGERRRRVDRSRWGEIERTWRNVIEMSSVQGLTGRLRRLSLEFWVEDHTVALLFLDSNISISQPHTSIPVWLCLLKNTVRKK